MTGFRAPRKVAARWRSREGAGVDHVEIGPEGGGIVARGTIVGERGGAEPYGVQYRIDCDAAWRVRALALGTNAGHEIRLVADGDGRWTNEAGERLPAFDGCIDVDLAGTPFTNILPIRRLDWREGERRELRMLYVPFDSFAPTVDGQIYTCLEPGRRFLYEAADRSFSAELVVDEDGLVTDYPALFSRMP